MAQRLQRARGGRCGGEPGRRVRLRRTAAAAAVACHRAVSGAVSTAGGTSLLAYPAGWHRVESVTPQRGSSDEDGARGVYSGQVYRRRLKSHPRCPPSTPLFCVQRCLPLSFARFTCAPTSTPVPGWQESTKEGTTMCLPQHPRHTKAPRRAPRTSQSNTSTRGAAVISQALFDLICIPELDDVQRRTSCES